MTLSKWFYNGLFALLAAMFLLIWQGVAAWQLWQLFRQPTQISVTQISKPPTPWISVSQFHLFGNYVAKSDSDDTSLSSLDYSVIGIFLAVPSSESTALLDLGDGTSKIYHVGDNLQGDVKLYKILKDSVVIEREGRYESIPLDKETLQFEPKAEPLPLDSDD